MDEPYEKKSFLIYKHFFTSIRHLSNEDLGLLFRTICEYQCGKDNLDYVDPKIEIAFMFYKNQFDLDDERYKKRVNANRKNALKNVKN